MSSSYNPPPDRRISGNNYIPRTSFGIAHSTASSCAPRSHAGFVQVLTQTYGAIVSLCPSDLDQELGTYRSASHRTSGWGLAASWMRRVVYPVAIVPLAASRSSLAE